MISAVAWARKSAMSDNPRIMSEPTDAEMEEMRKMAEVEMKEAKAKQEARAAAASVNGEKPSEESELPPEFDMENYDSDGEEGTDILSQVLGVKGLMYHDNNAEDPYITMKDAPSDSDEEQDLRLKATDTVVLAAKAEEEYSSLEIHVYESDTGSFYVHHDIALPAFPLCVEWLDCSSNETSGSIGSYVAVGTFRPQIEIWDLNTIGAMEPTSVLGGQSNGVMVPESHTNAILGLSWNASQRNLLLSCSADRTVKLWDVTEQRCALTMRHHNDKVAAVRWNPAETSVMASASFDRSAVVLDVRTPLAGLKLGVAGDAEELQWNPHNPALLLTATDSGAVYCHDVRMASSNDNSENKAAVWTLQAHNKSVTSLSLSPLIQGLMATSSADKSVKLWDIAGARPSCVASKNLQIGSVFCASFNPEHPYTLCCGGEDGRIAVWETSEQNAVENRFASRVLEQAPFTPGNNNAAATETAESNNMVLGDSVTRVAQKKRKNKKKKKGGKKR